MDYEKLGLFYLGRQYDAGTRARTDVPVLYDSSDLVTHAVIVGMTGSGKTGLGIDLMEEAAIDGIPVLAVDPKGDLANLLLTFPGLSGPEFAPWVNQDEARAAGQSPEAYGAAEAARWAKGLADWGQDGARITRLKAAADFVVYTPGSTVGRPISIVHSFQAPSASVVDDPDLLGDRVSTAATSVLTLAGVDAEPLRSREHILVSTLFAESWKAGRDMDLAGLIVAVQNPPITQVGVMDLEAFFPSKDRFALAMQLNQLLAAPSFAAWQQGDAAGPRHDSLHARRQAARGGHFDRAPRRPRADVLRLAAPERAGHLDAGAARHVEPARAGLLRRDLRLPAAGGQPAVQGAAPEAAEAGARVRRGPDPGHAEPCGPRLQGVVELRHLDAGPAADRTRQGPRAGRPRGRGRQLWRRLRPRGAGPPALVARQARLPAAQRARQAPDAVRDAVDARRTCAVRWGATRFDGCAHPRRSPGPGRRSPITPLRCPVSGLRSPVHLRHLRHLRRLRLGLCLRRLRLGLCLRHLRLRLCPRHLRLGLCPRRCSTRNQAVLRARGSRIAALAFGVGVSLAFRTAMRSSAWTRRATWRSSLPSPTAW